MAHVEPDGPKPLSLKELGQKSFNIIEIFQSSLHGLKNSAFKQRSVNAVFEDSKAKVKFNIGNLSYRLEVENALSEIEDVEEPYKIRSKKVSISRANGENTGSVELRSSWYEDSQGGKKFSLGGIKVKTEDTEYEDTEEAYEQILVVLGKDIYPPSLSPI